MTQLAQNGVITTPVQNPSRQDFLVRQKSAAVDHLSAAADMAIDWQLLLLSDALLDQGAFARAVAEAKAHLDAAWSTACTNLATYHEGTS